MQIEYKGRALLSDFTIELYSLKKGLVLVDFSQIQIFIIETPDSDRSKRLKDSLGRDPRVHLEVIQAKMIRNASDLKDSGIQVESEFFWALTNRSMSFPEIGCAFSHNVARHAIAQSQYGGIVFEDDARIINLDLLIEVVSKFLLKHKNESALLSLTHSVFPASGSIILSSVRDYRLLGDSPLAVAYALTPIAAEGLLTANEPLRYVSDWPEAQVKKFCLTYPLVLHGDTETQSVIDPFGTLARTDGGSNFSLTKIFLLHFFFRARRKVGFMTYLKYVFLKPVKFYLDILRMKFVKRS